ncbi:hypothetical protein OSH64_02145 [Mycobacterium ulcerans]|uniref:Uncharacterized protein n=1 Tax=Mycobacterium ulcerans (strain Agy99) TaxID=362242 RepID=A0PTT5_MYCUA|nr:conserved hypothetical protein [Mycobacterium ulcerans Agy99]MEB4166809.1 hypothetical protein [Mycobacterium ulcerans]MEB4337241.1 hypothetical protein [Mycobacterium ulcerans]
MASRKPVPMAEPLDAQDVTLVTLARAEADSGAALRDVDDRTYVAVPVGLSTLTAPPELSPIALMMTDSSGEPCYDV